MMSFTEGSRSPSYGSMSETSPPPRHRFAHSAARYYMPDPHPAPPKPPPPAAPATQFRARLNGKGHRVPWRPNAEDLPRGRSLPTLSRAGTDLKSALSDPSLSQVLGDL